MKRYANVLSDAIARSGWTYQQVAIACTNNGVKISKSYISKISSGAMPPPSDRMNEVLSSVLSSFVTYEELAVAKYKEIVPADVMKVLVSNE